MAIVPLLPVAPIEGTPVSRLREKAEEVKRRGSKPGVKRGPYKTDSPSGAGVVPPSPVPAAPAFNSDNFKRVISLPNSYLEFHTGVAGWAFTPDELTELAINGVPAFNESIPIAPKWIHWSLFLLSYITIMATKTLGYMAYLRELARQRMEAHKAKSSPTDAPPVSTELTAGPIKPLKTPPMQ